MRRFAVGLATVGLLVASTAQADPITFGVHASTGGATTAPSPAKGIGQRFLAGEAPLPQANATVVLLFGELSPGANYTIELLMGGAPASRPVLPIEVPDPAGSGPGAREPQPRPGFVPPGHATSRGPDGLRVAQDAGLERSAVFLGGEATIVADERMQRGDILLFPGVSGPSGVGLGAEDPIATPEPASMLLIGTGLGALALRRRRRRQRLAE